MKVAVNKLTHYIENEEVVYQRYGGLIEVSNRDNETNRISLIDDLHKSSSVEIYKKDDSYICDSFSDLNNWSTNDDILILLQIVGTLICIPAKTASEKRIINE